VVAAGRSVLTQFVLDFGAIQPERLKFHGLNLCVGGGGELIAHPRLQVRKIRRGNHEIPLKFSFPIGFNRLRA
jgi:hypothetical protein